jgi:hypothetical protein
LKCPDISRLENAFGKRFVSVMENINKINVIDIIEKLQLQQQQQDNVDHGYDITINTLGDSAPYFHPSFSKDNAVTYCHYPAAKYHIESENIIYLEKDREIVMKSNISAHSDNKSNEIDSSTCINKDNDDHYELSEIKEYFSLE